MYRRLKIKEKRRYLKIVSRVKMKKIQIISWNQVNLSFYKLCHAKSCWFIKLKNKIRNASKLFLKILGDLCLYERST